MKSAFETKALKEMIRFYKENGDDPALLAEEAEHELAVMDGTESAKGYTKRDPDIFKTIYDEYRGTMTINLLDFVQELAPELKQNLVEDGGWWAFISSEMVAEIIHGLATKNFNSHYFEMRQSLLQGEVVPHIMSQFIKSLADELKWEIQCDKKYRDAWFNVYHSHWAEDSEFRDFMSSFDTSTPHPEHIPNETVDLFVATFMEATGIAQEIEETRQMEERMLAERDPEASARAVENEENRKKYHYGY